MRSKTRTTPRLAVAMLLGLGVQTVHASGIEHPASFKTLDSDKDGNLSMKEFTAKGLDDLAFRAADVDSDGNVDPDEYDKYRQLKKNDPLGSGSGNTEPAKPGGSPPPTRSP